jgi:hypothetical protein
MINSREFIDGSLAAQAHPMQGPPPVPTDPRGRALRLVYPSRPVLDTAGTLSTNIRAGSKVGPQNDSSEKKREGRLAGAPGGPLGEREESMTAGVRSWGYKKRRPPFWWRSRQTPGSCAIPSPIRPFTHHQSRDVSSTVRTRLRCLLPRILLPLVAALDRLQCRCSGPL